LSRATAPGNGEFNTLLFSAVDRALVESMGESVSTAIKACLQISTIAVDPNGFSEKLARFTGGTKLIERKIMRNLEVMISERSARPIDPTRSEHQDLGGFIETCRGQYGLA
jgi:hypothetical protein